MRRFAAVLILALAVAPVSAGVVVLANFTPASVTVTITEPDQKPRTVTFAPAQVAPVTVNGPADITFPAGSAKTTLRLDPFNAYVFVPDAKAGRRLEGIELPGDPPERDARPELNPSPREPVKIPVTLLVDNADPRTDELWHKTVRARFDEAAAVIAAHAGVQLEFAGFATWKSDPFAKDMPALLADFEGKVKVKPGHLAIGYTSRRIEAKDTDPLVPFGQCRPFPTRHVLLREWAPRADVEKVEVLIHHLGLALGCTYAPDLDLGSVMRPRLADGLALRPQYHFRFDPLNVLLMNLWADELRRGPIGNPADASAANKIRLARVYKAQMKLRPGDPLALAYLNEFDRELAKKPDPKKEKPKDPAPANPDPPPMRNPRDEVARAVVRAITVRAKANTGAHPLTGDNLTAAYVRAATGAALNTDGLNADSWERIGGFLIGLGVALDDTDTLRNHPLAGASARAAESDEEHDDRLTALGNPTIHGRRDLCRRFAIGCGLGEILSPSRAEEAAVARTLDPDSWKRPAGVSFPALALEIAGERLSQTNRENLDLLNHLAKNPTLGEFLPKLDGLRDGIAAERFADDYGDGTDDRFQGVLADIRQRVKKLAPAQ